MKDNLKNEQYNEFRTIVISTIMNSDELLDILADKIMDKIDSKNRDEFLEQLKNKYKIKNKD